MITALKSKAEEHTGYEILAAVVTVPHLLALYAEDILDALEYCGLQHLRIPVRVDLVVETSAAYAGYGFGLCADYTNFTACHAEEDVPWDYVSAIVFYQKGSDSDVNSNERCVLHVGASVLPV